MKRRLLSLSGGFSQGKNLIPTLSVETECREEKREREGEKKSERKKEKERETKEKRSGDFFWNRFFCV